MNQPNQMTCLQVVDIETLEVSKTVYLTNHDPKQIQAMSDSLLRNLNTFQFFVRATPSAGPVASKENGPTDAKLAHEVLREDLEAIADYWDGTIVETARHGEIDVGQNLRERFASLKFPVIAAAQGA